MIEKIQNWFMSFPKDKVIHVGISCLIVILVSGLFRSLEFPLRLAVSAIIGLTFGVVKEIVDLILRDTEFSWNDLMADFLGVILGVLIIAYV